MLLTPKAHYKTESENVTAFDENEFNDDDEDEEMDDAVAKEDKTYALDG